MWPRVVYVCRESIPSFDNEFGEPPPPLLAVLVRLSIW